MRLCYVILFLMSDLRIKVVSQTNQQQNDHICEISLIVLQILSFLSAFVSQFLF